MLPEISLGELRVSRLLVGGNPLSGFSHQSADRSARMVRYFTVRRIKELLRRCERNGISGTVARADAFIMRVLQEYWAEGGSIRWVAQTAPEHRSAETNIRAAAAAGASAIFHHGGETDALLASGNGQIVRDRLALIRDLGLPAGMAGHDPRSHLHAQDAGYPLDFHMVCLYNITGYRGEARPATEEVFDPADRAESLAALTKLSRPAILYKVLGAGRLSLAEGLADVRRAIRPGDGIVLGMFPPDGRRLVERNVAAVAAIAPE
jgi:hypothetical protein